MTALLTMRHDQNFGDALVMLAVTGGILTLALADYVWARFQGWREDRATRAAVQTHAHGPAGPAAYVPHRAFEVDHEACTGDGCEQVVCFCRQQVTCPGTLNVGCVHLTQDGVLCADCRTECSECRFEDEVERAVQIVREGWAS